ncbi:hypothetical protein EDEG_03374 [Edhazardia aedis USNM 41457]|uniref:Uncharacterized protein n=1 Tax=Edhazardia aedis (strain USNM 41457) TaxID=1003232 RepID=J8ZR62_EDHAE|nr:hypothetical protein EDEG_03374 [Edhazardia aedis USNM 41457]|eukprot:EJW02178.1 hypothetical protein EDEG_03374 [Edhazardia aedis USNM 41457]
MKKFYKGLNRKKIIYFRHSKVELQHNNVHRKCSNIEFDKIQMIFNSVGTIVNIEKSAIPNWENCIFIGNKSGVVLKKISVNSKKNINDCNRLIMDRIVSKNHDIFFGDQSYFVFIFKETKNQIQFVIYYFLHLNNIVNIYNKIFFRSSLYIKKKQILAKSHINYSKKTTKKEKSNKKLSNHDLGCILGFLSDNYFNRIKTYVFIYNKQWRSKQEFTKCISYIDYQKNQMKYHYKYRMYKCKNIILKSKIKHIQKNFKVNGKNRFDNHEYIDNSVIKKNLISCFRKIYTFTTKNFFSLIEFHKKIQTESNNIHMYVSNLTYHVVNSYLLFIIMHFFSNKKKANF